MYAQAAIKPNTLLRNGAYGIVMSGVQKCTCAGASLRGRNFAPLCCIKLDTATECACGKGAISKCIAPKCKKLIATDFSVEMLKQASKKCRIYSNVKIEQADIMRLKFRDNCFDKVVAGNVVHLLEEPYEAIKELERVCKIGGKIIIPTYINASNRTNKKAGYKDVDYSIIDGRMPCAVAIITKQ